MRVIGYESRVRVSCEPGAVAQATKLAAAQATNLATAPATNLAAAQASYRTGNEPGRRSVTSVTG